MAKTPKSPRASAAAPPPDVAHICAAVAPSRITLTDDVSPMRASAIIDLYHRWANGTVLHYHFVEDPAWDWPEPQKAVVRWAFAQWKGLGIGLEFVETPDEDEAEICIGRWLGDGSWSAVGTDSLDYRARRRSMNLGWNLTTPNGRGTALHEIGHAIGLKHEAQNPNAGIVWNEDAVYAAFSGPPNNWGPEKIFNNILKKLNPWEVNGSTWDPTSIMQYSFPPGLIIAPKPYDNGIPETNTLSPMDIEWARRWYPALAAPTPINVMEVKPVAPQIGAQTDFLFVPAATREYAIRTVGKSDSRLVMFVERGGEARHFASKDDSGTPANAEIVSKLVKGERYTIRVRNHYAEAAAGPGLLIA